MLTTFIIINLNIVVSEFCQFKKLFLVTQVISFFLSYLLKSSNEWSTPGIQWWL